MSSRVSDRMLGELFRPRTESAPAKGTSTIRLLMALVLTLSAFIQLTMVSKTQVDVPLRADSGEYLSYAFNLRNYGVYSIATTWADVSTTAPTPDAFRPPGYPLFLALVGSPEPLDWYLRRVSFVQAGLGILSVLLIYLISARFLPAGLAVLTALLTAVSPHLAIISTLLLSESLFCFLLLASTLSLIRAVESRNPWMFALTGALWGLSSLVRSTSVLFLPALLILVFLMPRLHAYRVHAVAGLLCFLAVMAPWTIRNMSDRVVKPESSLMVKALAHGSYPNFMYKEDPKSFGFPYRFDPKADEIARDLPSVITHIGEKFREEPAKYFRWFLLGKPEFFLSWGNVQGIDIFIHPVKYSPYYEVKGFWLLRQATYYMHWPLMALGIFGVALLGLRGGKLLTPERRDAALLVGLLVAYAIAFHIVVAPFPRYGIPFRPFLYALSMLPLLGIWRLLSKRLVATGEIAQTPNL